jgi:DNA (cytosine-5)-methyltransferase 1
VKSATLFSGLGAPEVAMPSWDWLWCAEIEKFPNAVLAHRHPESFNLGNVNGKDFVERAVARGRPNVLVFGTPCQDFSVAGQRLGLAGARGNMALRALEVAHSIGVEWLVFENVPGLFSSYSGGAETERFVQEGAIGGQADCIEDSDFAAFLTAVRQCGYLGCWRVLDAQFAGVPQRRRRIFFVGRLGDWRGPTAVLFEPDSLRGDYPPSREARQRIAEGTLSRSLSRVGGGDDTGANKGPPLVVGAVSSKWSKGTGGPAGDECYNLVADPISTSESKTYTHEGKNNFRPHNLIAFDTTQITHPDNRSNPDDRSPPLATTAHPPAIAFSCKDHGADALVDQSPTLRAGAHKESHANAGVPPAIAFQTRISRNGRGNAEEVVPTLNGADAGTTSDMRPCVAVFKPSHFTRDKDGAPSTIVPPLGKEPDKGDQESVLFNGAAVRRLTPRECERLQGFPDDYTLVDFRGKPAADGPRYKALGNAMCVNEIRWILQRIETFNEQHPRHD